MLELRCKNLKVVIKVIGILSCLAWVKNPFSLCVYETAQKSSFILLKTNN